MIIILVPNIIEKGLIYVRITKTQFTYLKNKIIDFCCLISSLIW